MSSPGSYLVRHGAGFKFQMAVPRDLRAVIGRRMWRRYLPGMNAQEARLAALQLAVECRREIDRLRATLRGAGATRAPSFDNLSSILLPPGPARPEVARRPTPPPQLPQLSATYNLELSISLDRPCNDNPPLPEPVAAWDCAAFAPATNAITHRDQDASEGAADEHASVLDLVELWREIARPRAKRSTLRMITCANMLIDAVGPKPAASVSRSDIMQFRDHLETTDLSRSTARLYLQGIHRLFSVALSEGRVAENPASGIQLRPGTDKFADRDRRRPFEPTELADVFGALYSEPEEFRWIIRLLAYHGLRSGEVVQLHADDVTHLFGVPVLRVHDKHGSIKNRFSQRDVPLHPECADFLAYASARPSGRIFPVETWRADRFQRYAGVFLRKRAQLDDPTLTMHSLRHTWRTLAREIGMPAPVSRAIMGHSMGSDVHEGYGAGPSLRLKAEWMAQISPLAITSEH